MYIIQSLVDQSFYIGWTSDLANRILLHNSGNFNKGITRLKIPWEYFFILEVPDKKVAIKIERHIKSMKSRKYIHDLKRYPEIGRRLIEKYS
jgi:putative endonuclease